MTGLRLKCLAVAVAVVGLAADSFAAEGSPDPLSPAEIRAVMGRVTDWQLDHPRYRPTDWTNAVFHVGILAAYRTTGSPAYLEKLIEIADRARWRIPDRYRHADDHAIAQTYLELYRLDRDPRRLEAFQRAVDRMMAEPPNWKKAHQTIDYWWSDALFMSPPAVAKLAAVTGDGRYLDFMDRRWLEAYELLFDERQGLFHRDSRFREESPATFWSRGNAWVLAGLALLLEELPTDRPSRTFYETVFLKLATRVVELQGADGLWRSNLLRASSTDPGESSGTALFCFALAWGVREGHLDSDEFRPAVTKAWRALYRNVGAEGRLGWVQKPGAAPGKVSARHSEVYGSGAFLLAGELVYALEQEE